MFSNNYDLLYVVVVFNKEMHRQRREEMMRRAAQARLGRLVTERPTLGRTVMTWAGRRMVAAGQALLARASARSAEMPLALEQR